VLGEGRYLAIQRTDPLAVHPAGLEGGPPVGLYLTLNMEGAGPVAGTVGDLGGSEAAGGGEDVDGFQKARLARSVASQQEVGVHGRPPGERLEVSEVSDGEVGEHALRSASA
jgi:hypothetical protein